MIKMGWIAFLVLMLVVIASIGLAGSEKIKKSVNTTIEYQTRQAEQLQKSLEDIRRLSKPIIIPKGVRIKKRK